MTETRLGRIVDSANFLKYFLLSVPSTSVSVYQMTQLVERWSRAEPAVLAAEFEALAKTSDSQVILRAFQRDFLRSLDESIAQKICFALVENCFHFTTRDMSLYFDSPYYSAVSVILGLIDQCIPREKIQSFVEELVITASFDTIVTDIVEVCASKKTSSDLYNLKENTDHTNLIELGVARFNRRFIEEKIDLFDSNLSSENVPYILNRWSTKWKTSLPDKIKIPQYLQSILGRNVERLIRFLSGCAIRTNGQVSGFDVQSLRNLYDVAALVVVAKEANSSSLSPIDRLVVETFIAVAGDG